ncbi:AI-2E family transporter [Candidatus Gracilibacteria bacterium]|nr:AI-2E family transporter [Candidatus Gracilibacteria bacterium]
MSQIEVKKFSKFFLTKKFIKKIVAYLLLILFFYILFDFIFIFFLTFIFAYLFSSLGFFIKNKIDNFIDEIVSKNKLRKILKKVISINAIVLVEYIILIIMLVFTLSNVLPKIVDELVSLPEKVPFIKNEVDNVVTKLQDLIAFNTELGGSITEVVNTQDINIVFDIFNKLKSAGILFIKILLSLILSYVFIVDRHKLKKYFLGIKNSNFSFFYHEYSDFFERIVKSFGLIFKAQSLIALTNTILTAIGMYFIGMIYNNGMLFPYFITLIVIVFVCGFIPVLGTFISSLPILFIGYNMGGFSVIIAILLLISIIHMIEAYYLNPKIVSSFLNLPVSLTFVILIVSEHLFGMAGLLIGVSMFYFIEGLLKDADKGIAEIKGK